MQSACDFLPDSFLGIDEVTEYWNWDLRDFITNAFSSLSQKQKYSFAIWLAKEYDRTYTNSPPEKSLKKLNELLKLAHITIPNYPHFRDLDTKDKPAPKGNTKEVIESFSDGKDIRPIDFDPTDFEAVNQDIVEELQLSSSPYTVWRRCVRIINKISTLDDALKFTKLISKLDVAPLEDRLKIYETLKGEWGDISGSIHQLIKEGMLESLSMTSADSFAEDWQLGDLLRDICANCQGQEKDALCVVLKSLGTELNEFESSQWMRFAASFASHVSDTAIEKSLKRYLQIRIDDVPKELGDSKWSSVYEPPGSSEDIVANLVWNQLGSPSTSSRWRAAHAVIRNAEFGNSTIIEKLIEKFDTEDALPFHSHGLPFYYHHARLWLLISLSKIATETPLILIPMIARIIKLSELAGDHVLQKIYAVSTLQKIKDSDPSFSYDHELEEQKKLITPIAIIEREAGMPRRADSYGGRPQGVAKPELDFYFDYDFKKIEIDSLGALFGIHTWQVSDDMKNIIAKLGRNISGAHECPRNISREEHSFSEEQPYDYYLGYHALFIAAGRYVKEYPVIKYWSNDEWGDWLKEYSLTGSWLSDSIDYFPPSLPASEVSLEVYNEIPTLKERKSLAAQITDRQSLLDTDKITVSGSWSDEEDIRYSISSALIETSKVRVLAYALMVQNPWHNYLPINTDDFHNPWSNRGLKNPLSPLIGGDRDQNSRMDEHDPYGVDGTKEWLRPSDDIISDLELTFSNADGKIWVTNDNTEIFSSRIWGAKFGRGRHQHTKQGSDLKCSRDGLKSLLKKRKRSLIILVKAEKYHEHKKTGNKFINKSAIVIMTANGEIRVVQKIPKVIKDAAEKMTSHRRCDVMDCYDMVLKQLRK